MAVSLALYVTYQSVLKNTYYVLLSLSSELVVCGKDRKEGANVYVSGSRKPQSELARCWFLETVKEI